jgi:hypothetical protein
MACWGWASLPTLFSLIDALSEAIDGMQDSEWDAFLEFCNESRIGGGSDSLGKQDCGDLPVRIASRRAALLVGLRGSADVSTAIFLNYFRSTSISNPHVAEFRQVRALDAALAGLIDWKEALEIIRLTYKQGAWRKIARVSDLSGRVSEPPSWAIDQILMDSTSYPVHLWSQIEMIATR